MSTLKVPVTSADHIQGQINAPITFVEYGDYQCPYCGTAYPIVKKLQKHFKNDMRFVFRNFPLTNMHPQAEIAAETAEFADSHQRFWDIHDLIYENQNRLNLNFLFELVETLQLPAHELEVALEKKDFEPKVRHDFLGGVRSGVNGTPTFFINEQRYNGLVEYEDLVAAIDLLLAKQPHG
jgi:protein-disulfide isomerase